MSTDSKSDIAVRTKDQAMSNSDQTQHIELKIPCVSDYVGVVRLAISGIATRLNFSVEDIEDLKIAVSEACTNAVQYADYPKDADAFIWIDCYVHKDKLEIQVADKGQGFDVSEVESREGAVIPTEDRPNLGLGITFMKSLMDEVNFDSKDGKGTTVTLIKKY